jgi:hypothetical protein
VKKTIVLVILSVLLFTGCSESSSDNASYDNYIALKVVCVEGLEAYRGYSGYPAMYKRDINDKLIPCDINKFKK